MNFKILGPASLVAASVIWGGSVVAQKFTLQIWNPYFVLLMRGGGTLLLVLPYLILKKEFRMAGNKERLFLVGMGVAGLANSLFVLLGLQHTSATEAGMIMGITPIITALMLVFRGEKSLDAKGWAGCLMTVLGVGLVVFQPEGGSIRGSEVWPGDFLILLGVISWSTYTLMGKKAMSRHAPSLIMASTWAGVSPIRAASRPTTSGCCWAATRDRVICRTTRLSASGFP